MMGPPVSWQTNGRQNFTLGLSLALGSVLDIEIDIFVAHLSVAQLACRPDDRTPHNVYIQIP